MRNTRVLLAYALCSVLSGCADVLGVDFEGKRLAPARPQVLTDPSLPDADNYFGSAVDLDGDRLIIGAPAARAYIAERVGEHWVLVQTLTNPATTHTYNGFGGSVAISGAWAVVGDYGNIRTELAEPGEAFVFKRGAKDFEYVTRLDAGAYRHAVDRFAFDLAIDGETLSIGAYGDHEHGDGTGAVYVYTLSAGAWIGPQKLTLDNPVPGDEFGSSVALDGGTLVASAPGRSTKQGNHTGAVYAFDRRTGFGAPPQVFVPSDEYPSDYRLKSVAVSGDSLITGAPEAGNQRGEAYVFERSTSNWNVTPIATLPESNDERTRLTDKSRFGTSVALDGAFALVTTREPDGRGAGLLYSSKYDAEHGVRTWSFAGELSSERADTFGFDAAIQGRTVVVGAPQQKPSGAVYVFSIP